MQEKLTIIDSKRINKQNTLPTKNAVNGLYDATVCYIRFFGWISGVLNDMCVSGLCGLASLPFDPQ